MILLFLLKVGVLAATVASFNVDVANPIVLNKPSSSSSSSSSSPSYFGFSALLQKSSAYIGAPNYEVPA